ncbi:MAG: TIGR04190 family B12-binding domain/radical SAM domain protein [bacterium]|nr:MAG: TIGR04190 family B12-binding domain/radical SAM domain protein [bacterium]
MRPDLLLIHTPAVYDFRRRATLYGPISDVIPSTPVFEMYPLGFATLSRYLSRKGFNVRILNLAMKMLLNRDFDPVSHMRRFRPRMFGLDLHWLPHAQGVMEVARILKELHPDTPIVVGGLSASYYHREILEGYPQIDYVIRGDCAEEPLEELLRVVRRGGDPSGVPNLSYRTPGGPAGGEITHVPDTLDNYDFDYRHMVRRAFSTRDPFSYLPFRKWFFYPITAVLTCKGCMYNCITCGGSHFAYGRVANRRRLALKDPEIVAREAASISTMLRGPIFFTGDILQGGVEHFHRMMAALRPLRIPSEVMVEFFAPPPREILEELTATFNRVNIEISPESQEEKVRAAFGRPFDNGSLERFIVDAGRTGIRRLDLFFMTGLPHQTSESVSGIVDYCRDLFQLTNGSMKLNPFIAPLAPFVDPGSMVFEDPERFGYHLRFRSLEEHRRAMMSENWKEMLNYETRWMSRDALAHATYEAGIGLTRLKERHGLIKRRVMERVVNQARAEMDLLDRPAGWTPDTTPVRRRSLARLLDPLHLGGGNSLCKKEELQMPVSPVRLHFGNLLRMLFLDRAPVKVKSPSEKDIPRR